MTKMESSDSAGVHAGSGRVDAIQTSDGCYAGRALIKSFIPNGWGVRTNAPEREASILNPLIVSVEYTSPGQDAFITFSGTRTYDHLDNTPQNAQLQGQISSASRIIKLAYRDARCICEGCVQGNPNLVNPRLISESNEDSWAEKRIRESTEQYAREGLLNPGGNWNRQIYEVYDKSGRRWFKVIEALVLSVYLPVTQEEQMMYQLVQQTQMRNMGHMFQLGRMSGGLLGGLAGLAGGMANNVQPPQPKLRWSVDYVLESACIEGQERDILKYFEEIRDTIEFLPFAKREMENIRQQFILAMQQETNAINNAMSQMNRDQMASWDRKRAIIQDASDYGSQVMRDMRESNAATVDRINNLRSEAIRGVNTYHTNGGDYRTVEASIMWDHVYQNRQNPDYFAASQGGPFEFGVDYEELDRTKGDY